MILLIKAVIKVHMYLMYSRIKFILLLTVLLEEKQPISQRQMQFFAAGSFCLYLAPPVSGNLSLLPLSKQCHKGQTSIQRSDLMNLSGKTAG